MFQMSSTRSTWTSLHLYIVVVTYCLLLQTKGEHGADVTLEARPLPLEYLIIELTTSSPRNPLPLLPGGKGVTFPVENRASVGQAVQVRVCCVSL